LNAARTNKDKITDKSQTQNLVDLFIAAGEALSICPSKEFEDERVFLQKAQECVLEWDNISNDTSGSYQTSPNSEIMFRKLPEHNAKKLKYLGITNSESSSNSEDVFEEVDITKKTSKSADKKKRPSDLNNEDSASEHKEVKADKKKKPSATRKSLKDQDARDTYTKNAAKPADKKKKLSEDSD
jgi:hypothetical protein